MQKLTTLIMRSALVQKLVFVTRVLWTVLSIIIPAAVGAYLAWKYGDMIVMAVGVAFGLFSLAKLFMVAYRAEAK